MTELDAVKAAIAERNRVDLAIVLVLQRGEAYSREIQDAVAQLGNECSHEYLRARLVRLASRGTLSSRLKRSASGGPKRRYYRLTNSNGSER